MLVIDIIKKELVGKKIKFLHSNNVINDYRIKRVGKKSLSRDQNDAIINGDKDAIEKYTEVINTRIIIGKHSIFKYGNIVDIIEDNDCDGNYLLQILTDNENYRYIVIDLDTSYSFIDKETIMIDNCTNIAQFN